MFELFLRVSKSLNVTSNVYFRGIKQIYFWAFIYFIISTLYI